MSLPDKKNIAVVCNARAGAGKADQLAQRILALLDQKKIPCSFYKETWPKQFNDFSEVWIVGGDGTLNFFVNLYPDIKIPLVIFRGGSGNDFHWMLYRDLDPDKQVHLVLSATPKPIDLGKCNERYFLNGTGIGFEGEVARSLTGKKKKTGKSSFMLMVLKKIISYRSKYYRVFAGEFSSASEKYLIIDITNGCRAGGGFHIAPAARPDDGSFDVILIQALPPLLRLRWLPVIEKGKHLGLSFLHHFQTTKIRIESDSLIQAHLDGEYYEAVKLEIEIEPGKLFFLY